MNEQVDEQRRAEILEPVSFIPPDDRQSPQRGTALCLSGGGYSAVLFHVGALVLAQVLGEQRNREVELATPRRPDEPFYGPFIPR